MELLLQYLVLGITLAISIGPVNLELIKQGMTKGFIPSWLVASSFSKASQTCTNNIKNYYYEC
jgi:threonine/homoserine/homoserine lactone efflux protein